MGNFSTVENIVMACRAQIQQHVHQIMEARDLMREAEDPSLTKLRRITILSEATDIVHKVIENLGPLSNLVELRRECHHRFMEACN